MGNAAGRSVDIVNKVRTCSNLTNLVTSFNYLRVFRAVVNILENSRSMLMPSPVCDLAFFVMQGISQQKVFKRQFMFMML